MNQGKGDVDKISTGRYRATYTPFGPGPMLLQVNYGDQEVVQVEIMITSGVDATKCELINVPSEVVVGSECRFQIQARYSSSPSLSSPSLLTFISDSAGLQVTVGGEKFELGVSGPKGGVTGLVVRDELDGTYSVKFTLTLAGIYSIFFLSIYPSSMSPSSINSYSCVVFPSLLSRSIFFLPFSSKGNGWGRTDQNHGTVVSWK